MVPKSVPEHVSTDSSSSVSYAESVEEVMMHKEKKIQHGYSDTNVSPFQHSQNATLDVREMSIDMRMGLAL